MVDVAESLIVIIELLGTMCWFHKQAETEEDIGVSTGKWFSLSRRDTGAGGIRSGCHDWPDILLYAHPPLPSCLAGPEMCTGETVQVNTNSSPLASDALVQSPVNPYNHYLDHGHVRETYCHRAVCGPCDCAYAFSVFSWNHSEPQGPLSLYPPTMED
ncbi:uncharacterized [Tachysurus ichikawai]